MVDYVVVGAGSAGCALANRLSEDPSVNVRQKLAGFVVDPQLRVIDCSVMPGLPSGNTNAPALATGLRAAEIIKHNQTVVA